MTPLLVAILVLLAAAVALLLVLLGRTRADAGAAVEQRFAELQRGLERADRLVRDEMSRNREETAASLARVTQALDQRLAQVQRGLGEMQTLAEGVGDLKRVLTNVKTRGVLGEWQLQALLEQLLTPDQFARNVKPNPARDTIVEFAIRIPAHGGDGGMWLPVDSKYPAEDYARLFDAQERADAPAVAAAQKALAVAVRRAADDIRTKYLDPPNTTDYAILFLPSEGLFAEVVRLPGLVEALSAECRVMIAGPTTFATLLNCLQMGFRSMALAQRSEEVWRLLGAVRTEFGKFGDAVSGAQKKLSLAADAVEQIAVRARAMDRRLRDVEQLPAGDDSAPPMLTP
ncbi:MAG TPA: DNA recombination protein RmuC [Gemmatimonadaceae bacterium]|nr:DNA recombination protein RmuC [Gemmatimonadaceae bacterium]